MARPQGVLLLLFAIGVLLATMGAMLWQAASGGQVIVAPGDPNEFENSHAASLTPGLPNDALETGAALSRPEISSLENRTDHRSPSASGPAGDQDLSAQLADMKAELARMNAVMNDLQNALHNTRPADSATPQPQSRTPEESAQYRDINRPASVQGTATNDTEENLDAKVQELSGQVKQLQNQIKNLTIKLRETDDNLRLAQSRLIQAPEDIYYSTTSYYPGIVGHYFAGKDFDENVQWRIDSQVNFNWGTDGVDILGGRGDQFSVRWKGALKITKKGRYHFHARSDDGVRVYLGNHLVLNEWNDHPPKEDITEVELEEGYYPLKVEFYENGGFAVLELYWQSDTFDRELIPASHFYHTNADQD